MDRAEIFKNDHDAILEQFMVTAAAARHHCDFAQANHAMEGAMALAVNFRTFEESIAQNAAKSIEKEKRPGFADRRISGVDD